MRELQFAYTPATPSCRIIICEAYYSYDAKFVHILFFITNERPCQKATIYLTCMLTANDGYVSRGYT